VKHPNRLRFSRSLLLGITLLDLALIFLSVLLIQGHRGLVVGTGYAVAVLSVVSFLPVAREWLSPSHLELAGDGAELKWNNWRLTGTVVSADLPAKKARRLVLALSDIAVVIDPVGPLFLLASLILYPVLRPLPPAWWAPLYVISKKQLSGMLGASVGGALTISLPTIIFGRRRLHRALKNNVV